MDATLTEEDIKTHFSQFGTVNKTIVPTKTDKKGSKYATIDFRTSRGMGKALLNKEHTVSTCQMCTQYTSITLYKTKNNNNTNSSYRQF